MPGNPFLAEFVVWYFSRRGAEVRRGAKKMVEFNSRALALQVRGEKKAPGNRGLLNSICKHWTCYRSSLNLRTIFLHNRFYCRPNDT